MEEVLDLYAEPYDPQRPLVCFDEKPVLLHADVHPAQPVAPGQPQRQDYEYERLGHVNLFFVVEPLGGWRHVLLTERRTKLDYARCLRWLVDVAYPEATCIRLVQDNLNTHAAASLYDAFPPEEARRILRRLELHYTPKHASWLNMAEIEISIFERACLGRRVESVDQLWQRIGAVGTDRNARQCRIHWRFTTEEARVKLHNLYPKTKLD
jgi:hypothetical protein